MLFSSRVCVSFLDSMQTILDANATKRLAYLLSIDAYFDTKYIGSAVRNAIMSNTQAAKKLPYD